MELDKIIKDPELKHKFYQIIDSILISGMKFLKAAINSKEFSMAEQNFDGMDYYNSLLYRKKLVLSITTNPKDENSSSSNLISIISLSLSGLIKILREYKTDPKNNSNWSFLIEYNLLPEELTTFSQPRKIFFSHLIMRCFDLIFEPACMNQSDLDILSLFQDLSYNFSDLESSIEEIIDLELSHECILEYYYFFYGIGVNGDIKIFNQELKQKIVYPTDKDRELLSRDLGIPRDIKVHNRQSDYESDSLLRNTTGWIHSSVRVKLSSLDNSDVRKSPHLKPPEFNEEGLRLLGFTGANVRFYCRTSANSKINYSIDIHNGYCSSGSGGIVPRWINDTIVHKWHFDTSITFNYEMISFLSQFVENRFNQRNNASFETIFGRFYRFTNFTRFFDKIIESSIIFEVLFPNRESYAKKQKLANRISNILSKSPDQKQVIQNFVEKIYEARNKIIHEGEFNLRSDFSEFISLSKASQCLYDVLRLCILRFVDFDTEKLLINNDDRVKIADKSPNLEEPHFFKVALQEFWNSYPSKLKDQN
ncbi:hypothetical protein NEF87_004837 [Candidatus Lokiarchaeum ossiferum]|uniref:Apea-like HEPN domain-containing protein n=1 Tax=Candidatus Lokiarchaeum ossiferum TaxID=2951803 RepID=A0ABY6I0A3_9ARCH|nr:hypothetical protein NEF87_004837 [Candidatus Lokiarchaeum sp. B-35]